MKVVCIEVPPTFVTIKLEVGGIYNAFYIMGYQYMDPNLLHILKERKSNSLFVEDSLGNIIPCDVLDKGKYFITLEKCRDSKLSELGV
jgi:hypothetical protein